MVAVNDSTVTISPGVTTGELMKFFLIYQICFESDVILPNVTYGGILSGGCHVSSSNVLHSPAYFLYHYD